MKRRTGRRTVTGSVDRYLHAILLLSVGDRLVDTGELARKVGVSDAASSRMLRTMAANGLVRVEPYRGAELTPQGLDRALRVVRRHRILESYLHSVMGFDLREAHERATVMQPAIDETFVEKLDAMLGRPRFDPHGQPIPSKNATWPKVGDTALLGLLPQTAGRVSRVASEDAEAIAWLSAQGVVPGTLFVLKEVAPFEGPVTIKVGKRLLHLGRRLASAVQVAVDSAATSRRRGRGSFSAAAGGAAARSVTPGERR